MNNKNILFFFKNEKLVLATSDKKNKNCIENIAEIKFDNNEIINQNIFIPTKIHLYLAEYIKNNDLKNCKALCALSSNFCLNKKKDNSREIYINNSNSFTNLKLILHLDDSFLFQLKMLFHKCNLELKQITFDKICHLYLKKNQIKIENKEYNLDFCNSFEKNTFIDKKDLLTIFGLYMMENSNE
ncbi:hypothetical protein M1446_04485 [Candidatus Dependentiae bacterium]|nr:hypothetical protein [Candidatus Dependentiae bacterium]